jgi:hypothetical protein
MKVTKTSLATSILVIAFAGAGSLVAKEKGHEGHDHAEHSGEGHKEAKAGPNGGKILTEVEPHLEFYVTKDRKVKITALDDHGKAKPIAAQSISIIAGYRSKPTRMVFTKKGEVLVSDKAFPKGNDFPVIIRIKNTPDADSVMEKFNLNLNDCPTCKHQEYACTCDHGCDGHEGHSH